MIIDSHCHAWALWPYEPPVPDQGSRALAEQLLWEMDRHGIDQALIVSARIEHNPGNNDYGAAAVRAHPGRLHQVADVDSRWSPEYHTPGAADRLRAAAARWPIKGVTHYLRPENDGWLRRAEGLAFFRAAEELKLVASIAGSPLWQADLREVARACPGLTILCHHLAGLGSWSGDADWALEEVLASAAVPNIMVKVSGFYYGAAQPWEYPHPEAIDRVRALHDAFGASRLCWGSDHPVAQLRAVTYRQALEALRHHCRFIPDDDMALVLGGTLQGVLQAARPIPPSLLEQKP